MLGYKTVWETYCSKLQSTIEGISKLEYNICNLLCYERMDQQADKQTDRQTKFTDITCICGARSIVYILH